MSAKSSKKTTTIKATSAVVTRTKSARNRTQPVKYKEIVKSTKEVAKPETKSTKKTKPETKSTKASDEICQTDSPLQFKVKQLIKFVEQVEYYPDKLKRIVQKKFYMKPKPNFKVIASTNKRKMGVPQKGGIEAITNIPETRISCNQMVDILDLIEDTHELSDEDFMEILTCPSPVWWENAPGEDYFEEPICTRMPSPSTICEHPQDKTKPEEQKTSNKITPVKNTSKKDSRIKKEQLNMIPTSIFNNRKRKLENVLRTIKNDKQINCKNHLDTVFTVNSDEKLKNVVNKCKINVKKGKTVNKNKIKTAKVVTKNKSEGSSKIKTDKSEIKNESNTDLKEESCDLNKNRNDNKITSAKVVTKNKNEGSNNIKTEKDANKNKSTTDKEEMSDLSFNEEELLKNLENMDIPIEQDTEQNITQNKIKMESKETGTLKNEADSNDLKSQHISLKKELIIPDKLPPLKRKPDLNNLKKTKLDTTISNLEHSVDGEISSNFKFITDDSIESTCSKAKKIKVNNNSSIDVGSSHVDLKKDQINDSSKNASDYCITVYKIMANGSENEVSNKSSESWNDGKVDKGTRKINQFFKTGKGTRRLKKSDVSFPAISVRKDLMTKKENNDNQISVPNLKQDNSDVNDDNRLKCDCQEIKNGTNVGPCEKCERTNIFACNLCNFITYTKESFMSHISSCKDRLPWQNNCIVGQT